MSQRQLQRLFHEHLGITPTHYNLTVRLRRARQLLLQTDMSIMSITTACGFQSACHFSKSYRDASGVAPTLERRKQLHRLRHTLEPLFQRKNVDHHAALLLSLTSLPISDSRRRWQYAPPLQLKRAGPSPVPPASYPRFVRQAAVLRGLVLCARIVRHVQARDANRASERVISSLRCIENRVHRRDVESGYVDVVICSSSAYSVGFATQGIACS